MEYGLGQRETIRLYCSAEWLGFRDHNGQFSTQIVT